MALLSIKKLSKQYGSEQVLKNMSLELAPGQITALLGKSGSGKSTLLKCINQLEQADSGSISIGAQHFEFHSKQQHNPAQIKQLRHQVGMVFQHFCLWPHLSALKNLTLAPVKLKLLSKEQAHAQAMAILDRFELKHKANAKPHNLSGGQQQRISIARSLMLKPELMLFDEPTSALDPEMTQEVLTIIKELKQDNMAMLISTHEIGFAQSIADEVCFLQHGNIIESGPNIIKQPKTAAFKQFLNHID